MNKRINHNTEFKKSIVDQVIKGSSSYKGLACKFSLSISLIKKWVSFYRKYGLEGIQPMKNDYSSDFKLKVIEEMRIKELSLIKTCLYFKIPAISTLKKWINVYDQQGAAGLAIERRGRPGLMPAKSKKPLSKEEELLKELADLKAENAYLKKLHALVQSEKAKEEKRKSSKN
jgi:transposase